MTSRAAAVATILAPLLAQVAPVVAADPLAVDSPGLDAALSSAGIGNDFFELDAAELDPIRFSRIDRAGGPAVPKPATGDRLTEFSLTLRPQLPDFSREGYYGLGIIGTPSVAVQSALVGPDRFDAAITDLNDGFAYSAGVRIEHENETIDGTAYVSSGLLGLSYGRLGRLWYGGFDVNLERFVDEVGGEAPPDVVSLDLTTGRRLGITGLGVDAPLWLLSLEGNVDLLDESALHEDETLKPEWFLNPSLFWQHPGFTFSAQMQVPVAPAIEDEETPDYRLRAVFEKRFR